MRAGRRSDAQREPHPADADGEPGPHHVARAADDKAVETELLDENTLTVVTGRLRRKLAELGLPDLILTKKGQGYLVQAP